MAWIRFRFVCSPAYHLNDTASVRKCVDTINRVSIFIPCAKNMSWVTTHSIVNVNCVNGTSIHNFIPRTVHCKGMFVECYNWQMSLIVCLPDHDNSQSYAVFISTFIFRINTIRENVLKTSLPYL